MAGIVTLTRGTTLPDSSAKADFHNLIDTATGTLSGITTADLSATAGIVDTQLATLSTAGKVNLTALVATSQAQGDIAYASSASVWSRLGAGTSGQFLKTNGAAANPTWATVNVAPQFRNNLSVVQASTTTMTVQLGDVEINGSVVSKTSSTTLTITTAGDWAGGSSLQATSSYGYVGIDASGNIKMHTTAPTHSDYSVSNTGGVKRYATWSSVVYRIIGWFYMNSTGSGELNSYEVGNIKDGEMYNVCCTTGATDLGNAGASYVSISDMLIHAYSVGRPIRLTFSAPMSTGYSSSGYMNILLDTVEKVYGSNLVSSASELSAGGGTNITITIFGVAQGTRTIQGQYKGASCTISSSTRGQRVITFEEL